ncbi:hypothetical protein [Silvanigrella aquatica]|uniref:hypothetical protein n=1 Tax=Silvanigrella aquatica TaxID=1915309 RepID=UPI0011E605A5|nr:hypothetical protein [Silvanigrella aquatica]
MYPEISSDNQLMALYEAIYMSNKHTKEFDTYHGESFKNPEKKLKEKTYLILLHKESLLYQIIFQSLDPDIKMVKHFTEKFIKEFDYLEDDNYQNNRIRENLKQIGILNALGTSQAFLEIGEEFKQRDYITSLIYKSNKDPIQKKGPRSEIPKDENSFLDALKDNFNEVNWKAESTKFIIEQSTSAVGSIANKIKELDYLLISYVNADKSEKHLIKTLITDKHAELQKLMPIYFQNKIKAIAEKRTLKGSTKNIGAKSLHNIKTTIKKAGSARNYQNLDLKITDESYKKLINDYVQSEAKLNKIKKNDIKIKELKKQGVAPEKIKLKDHTIFERYNAEKNKIKAVNKLENAAPKSQFVISNSEYSRIIKGMNYVSKSGNIFAYGIDAYLGYDEVKKAYDNGEDWHRKTVEESTKFGVGVGVGVALGVATFPILVLAGSVGIVATILVGGAIAIFSANIGTGIGNTSAIYATEQYDKFKNKEENLKLLNEVGNVYVPLY